MITIVAKSECETIVFTMTTVELMALLTSAAPAVSGVTTAIVAPTITLIIIVIIWIFWVTCYSLFGNDTCNTIESHTTEDAMVAKWISIPLIICSIPTTFCVAMIVAHTLGWRENSIPNILSRISMLMDAFSIPTFFIVLSTGISLWIPLSVLVITKFSVVGGEESCIDGSIDGSIRRDIGSGVNTRLHCVVDGDCDYLYD
jgi:hypothetical protein